MCKGGGSSVSGNANKVETIDENVNTGYIQDSDEGITFISIHLNTLVGSVTGTLIVIGLVTFLIYICSGPMRKCWKRMRGITRSSGTATRMSGGGSASGTEMQYLDRRLSEYPMHPYVIPVNPYTGFGHYGPQNNMGAESAAKVPPSRGEAATGSMTPVT